MFHYKGCKGTKTKAAAPEDGTGTAEYALSRLPPPTVATHDHGPRDIRGKVYMLGLGESQPGHRGAQAGKGLGPAGLHILVGPRSPLGAVSYLGTAGPADLGCQSTPSSGLVAKAMAKSPCPWWAEGQKCLMAGLRWAWIGPKFQNTSRWGLPSNPNTCHLSLAPGDGVLARSPEGGESLWNRRSQHHPKAQPLPSILPRRSLGPETCKSEKVTGEKLRLGSGGTGSCPTPALRTSLAPSPGGAAYSTSCSQGESGVCGQWGWVDTCATWRGMGCLTPAWSGPQKAKSHGEQDTWLRWSWLGNIPGTPKSHAARSPQEMEAPGPW
uniref:uncharacterized protein LOC108591724 n=1 Tax=Callithrix jacchus TaxID=9483 RepID=UPI00083FFBEE|nr:uncharacterized protein LOC108591724 [Callithrix jacchus]